jgi:hypothetical protein
LLFAFLPNGHQIRSGISCGGIVRSKNTPDLSSSPRELSRSLRKTKNWAARPPLKKRRDSPARQCEVPVCACDGSEGSEGGLCCDICSSASTALWLLDGVPNWVLQLGCGLPGPFGAPRGTPAARLFAILPGHGGPNQGTRDKERPGGGMAGWGWGGAGGGGGGALARSGAALLIGEANAVLGWGPSKPGASAGPGAARGTDTF